MSAAGTRFDQWHLEADALARALLGQRLVRVERGLRTSGIIIETEAYLGGEDLASHSAHGRRTRRNASMFLAGGHAYIYFVYGMHHCFNVVSAPEGVGAAVLVRAIEPLEGLERMRRRCNFGETADRAAPRPSEARWPDGRGRARDFIDLRRLVSGPARVCRALGLDRRLDGEPLTSSGRLFIERGESPSAKAIVVGPRIGVDYAGAWARAPLRFGIAGHPLLSRPIPVDSPTGRRRAPDRRLKHEPGPIR